MMECWKVQVVIRLSLYLFLGVLERVNVVEIYKGSRLDTCLFVITYQAEILGAKCSQMYVGD